MHIGHAAQALLSKAGTGRPGPTAARTQAHPMAPHFHVYCAKQCAIAPDFYSHIVNTVPLFWGAAAVARTSQAQAFRGRSL